MFRLVIPVPESYVHYIHIGDPVSVSVPSLEPDVPRSRWRGSPWMFVKTRAPCTPKWMCRIRSRVLLPGLYADATITLEKRETRSRCPCRPWIRTTARPPWTWWIASDKIEVRPIQIGIQTPPMPKSSPDLQEGDQVVVSDRSGLKAGQPVRPKMVDLIQYQSTEERAVSQQEDVSMPRFSIRNPYFIVVVCLALAVIGINALRRMPVDLFPPINLPEVVVATFYNGMPPQDIEVDITNPLERFFTQASGSITWSPARCWASASSRYISSPAPTPMPT